jgi:hypothetical protein
VVADLQSTAAPALEVKVWLDPTTPRASSPVGRRRFPRKNGFFEETTSHHRQYWWCWSCTEEGGLPGTTTVRFRWGPHWRQCRWFHAPNEDS